MFETMLASFATDKLLSGLLGKVGGAIDKGADSALERGVNFGFEQVGELAFPTPDPSAAELGRQRRQFLDAAHPHTNDLERLGAQSPQTAVQVQKQQASVQKDLVNRQVDSAQTITDKQTENALRIAEIHGRASAVAAASNYDNPEAAAFELGRFVEDGSFPGMVGRPAPARQAKTAELDQQVRADLAKLKELETRAHIGNLMGDPATASLRAMATQSFEMGIRKQDILAQMDKYYDELRALGVAGHVINAVSSQLRGFVGRLFVDRPTSVRPRSSSPRAPTAPTAPVSPRPGGPASPGRATEGPRPEPKVPTWEQMDRSRDPAMRRWQEFHGAPTPRRAWE